MFRCALLFTCLAAPNLQAQTTRKDVDILYRSRREAPDCFLVRIYFKDRAGADGNGTGVLIGKKHVLTAAHVVVDTARKELFPVIKFHPGFCETAEDKRPFGEYELKNVLIQGTFQKVTRWNEALPKAGVTRNHWLMQRTLDIAVVELDKEVTPAIAGFTLPATPFVPVAAYRPEMKTFLIDGYDEWAGNNLARRGATITPTIHRSLTVGWTGILMGGTVTSPVTVFETGAYGGRGSSGGPLWIKGPDGGMTVVGIVGGPDLAHRHAVEGPGLSGILLDDDYLKWIAGFRK